MPVTDHFYGGRTIGAGRTIQDFGLCDLKGEYVYTAKTRAKGLVVVVFFSPQSPPSLRALQAVNGWTQALPTAKWTALAVTEGDRSQLAEWAQAQNLTGISIVVDHELYQTRQWGISHLPCTYLIAGKTGRVLAKAIGDDAGELTAMQQMLDAEVAKIVAAEEAARKADEEKKAADAAAKAAAEAAKPAEPAKV